MKELFPLKSQKGFPGGSEVKASACNAEDLGLIPESERSPGEGNGKPLQYSCLENPMDGGAWWATVHWVAKSQILLSNLTNLTVKKDHESTHKNDLFFSFIMNYLTKGWLCIVLFLQNYSTLFTFQIFFNWYLFNIDSVPALQSPPTHPTPILWLH